MRISDWSSDVCSSDLSAQTGSVRTDRLYRRFGYLDLARRADRAIDQPRPHHPPKDQDPRHRQRGRQQVKVDIAEHLDQTAGTRSRDEPSQNARGGGKKRKMRRGETQVGERRQIGDDTDAADPACEILEPDRARHAPIAVSRHGEAREAEIGNGHQERSEEHTSDLQSLMRNSYAVFCWKTK